MSLFFKYNGADIGNAVVRLNAIGLSSAADSSVSMGGIVIDDPAGSLNIVGWKPFTIDESDSIGATRIFTGYVADRKISRGPFRTGTGRQWDTTLVDQNAVFGLNIITGDDGKRPAETHLQRIAWLLSTYLSGLVYDDGYVATGTPTPFGAADYRGQYPFDVLTDITIYATWFAFWNTSKQRLSLFFDSPVATTNTSSLQISNVLADIDNVTTFGPSVDAVLTRDPSQIYSTIRYVYAQGVSVTSRASTATAFIGRGLNVNNSRIGTNADSINQANGLLDKDASENDTIALTVQLPASKVGLIEVGQRLQVKFSHLPGFSTYTYTRVTHRTITQSPGTDKQYDVALELNVHGVSTLPGGGGAPPATLPRTACATVTTIQTKLYDAGTPNGAGSVLSFDTAPTQGNMQILLYTHQSLGVTTAPSGWTRLAQKTTVSSPNNPTLQELWYKLAASGESASSTWTLPNTVTGAMTLYEVAGDTITLLASANDTGTSTTGPTLSATAAADGLAIAFVNHGGGDHRDAANVTQYTGDYFLSAGGFTLAEHYNPGSRGASIGAHNVATKSVTAGAVSVQLGDGSIYNGTWSGILALVSCSGSTNAPAPGQWVYNESPTMVGANGTTKFPFADGSLTVYVDMTDQTAGLTAQNGAAGTFTLGFTPKAGEQVTVKYQGR